MGEVLLSPYVGDLFPFVNGASSGLQNLTRRGDMIWKGAIYLKRSFCLGVDLNPNC